ncbi:cytochrome b5-like Heme/Steroid binding domain protein [Ostertagia ostertagi]
MPMLNLPTLTAKPPIGRSEYGRVKVALLPGKGLMDWVRLASGKVLAKKRMSVDHDELMKHNKRDDCWVHIFGQVYDVTSYLEFHPGGIPELMRAAGTDATDLFNQYHAWVNYENMLKSCLVGRFTGDLSKLPQPGPTTIEQPQSISAQLNAMIMKGKQKDEAETYGISIAKDSRTLKISSDKWNSSNLRLGNVIVNISSSKNSIRVVVRTVAQSIEVKWDDVALNSANCAYEVLVRNGSILLTFEALDVAAVLATANQSIRQSPPSKVYRPYTPVSYGSLPEDPEEPERAIYTGAVKITFLIKIYEQGICTPSLGALSVGDTIAVSEPIGNIDLSAWISTQNCLLMLAAGTGLTPMVNVLRARLKKMANESMQKSNTRLLLFNKTENDIVNDDWLPMRWSDERITVEHILSNPSQEWKGRTGRINAGMLPAAQESLRVLICGPEGFNATAHKLLLDAGYKNENIHIFQG